MRRLRRSMLKRPWFTVALAVAAASPAFAQGTRRVIEEPQWLKWNVRDLNCGIYAEGTYDEASFNGANTVTHDREFMGPLVGASMGGSIYHPNLFRYQAEIDGALGYSMDHVNNGTRSTTREEFQFLGRFNGSAVILGNRPYNGSIFGGYDYSYRDYDFFNRVTVQSSQYGARAGYSATNYSVSAFYTHRDETADGLNIRTETHDDVLGMNARNDRATGSSTANYTYNRYSRSDLGRVGEGNDHTVSLSDYETWGTRHRASLNSSISYARRDTGTELTDQITGTSSLQIDHPRNLWSYYDATYDHYQLEGFTSDSIIASAQVRHQLFSSLSSSLMLSGADYEASDALSDGYTRRIGISWGEAYTKKLSATSRLSVANTLGVDHIEQSTISTVRNERHNFTENGDSFFLNLTDVEVGSIVVTDVNDTRPAFVEGIDYVVSLVGSRVLISRPSGSRIGPSDIVLVDYHVDQLTSGDYESLSDVFTARLELLNNHWGLFTRVNLWRNNADPALRVPNITSYTIGTDTSWRWFRAGIEYEIYDSDLAKYSAARAFQSAVFKLDQASTLSFNVTESRINYDDSGKQQDEVRFITRYHDRVSPRLALDVEGGIDVRRGDIINQTLATLRPGLQYNYGRTTIRASYDFEYNLTDNEERMRHLFTFRLRRTF